MIPKTIISPNRVNYSLNKRTLINNVTQLFSL